MATVVLAAAGAAIGGSFGGAVLGVSSAVIGKAVGATLGALIDQKIMGSGSATIESGRVDRLRVMGSREGTPIPRLYGQMRMSGQVIWSSRFIENVSNSGGGKGTPSAPTTKTYSYSINIAVAVCEGEITRINRIWADGKLLSMKGINYRVYSGDEDQLPDPVIAATLPDSDAPAYRGTAYVVFEELDLTPFGNRIPQLSFEVLRKAGAGFDVGVKDHTTLVRGVALVPGTGEYALATEPVKFADGKGKSRLANVNNDRQVTDMEMSAEQLEADLPNCDSISLVTTWFGDDLRCNQCSLRPKVEQTAQDSENMPWKVNGIPRSVAEQVSYVDGRPGFGGTPSDQSVIQAIRHIQSLNKAVLFYPFILMDIRAGNGLLDPWSGNPDQPSVPWRGRITLSVAAGESGSPDKSGAAAAEVDAFFGTASAADFVPAGDTVAYTGPDEWSYRRFILHYAHLCALAGGVEAFCIGSELRSLTQIRSDASTFPTVSHLIALAADVRGILGPDTKISYAADWTEYFGFHPADGSGDVLYHLDPLWANENIDFVGIDNYMPLSDWRDGDDHADTAAGRIYNVDYLKSNIEGGEGYDWYYSNPTERDAQIRRPINDGAYGDPWVFRYKDIRNWWGRPHWNRVGGIRETAQTEWVAHGKPIWFTELGCAAIDKGTNQPNVFVDPQSSENALPYYSNGGQDDYIQAKYLEAMLEYWAAPENNPHSQIYGAPMIDMTRAHVWAWDARPSPAFPSRLDVWADGVNHGRGHWISGRSHLVTLADVVTEIATRSGVDKVDVSMLDGQLSGFAIADTETARASLQSLMLVYGFDSAEQNGALVFRTRHGNVDATLSRGAMVVDEGSTDDAVLTRDPDAETPKRVRLGFVSADQDYTAVTAEASYPGADLLNTATSETPIALGPRQGQAVAERWLSETQIARDQISFALPRSKQSLCVGDVVRFVQGGRDMLFRVDRIEDTTVRTIDAVRIEPAVYKPRIRSSDLVVSRKMETNSTIYAEFMDLPLLSGSEVPHAPHVAVTSDPWAGPVVVFAANQDSGYLLKGQVLRPSVMGESLTVLRRADPGIWSNDVLRISVSTGTLQSAPRIDVLNGANVAALRYGGLGDWEVFQFETATLIGENQYDLTGLLRGQAGTDTDMPDLWPVGTDFVLLDGAAAQIDLPSSARGLARHYRTGPAGLPYDDPEFLHQIHTFNGVGLRPYAPVHAKATRLGGGDISVSWIRRTRIDGDSWMGSDVPLGENSEQYHVRVISAASVIREMWVSTPNVIYSAVDQAVDGAPASLQFEVAQISDIFGPGKYTRIHFDD